MGVKRIQWQLTHHITIHYQIPLSLEDNQVNTGNEQGHQRSHAASPFFPDALRSKGHTPRGQRAQHNMDSAIINVARPPRSSSLSQRRITLMDVLINGSVKPPSLPGTVLHSAAPPIIPGSLVLSPATGSSAA